MLAISTSSTLSSIILYITIKALNNVRINNSMIESHNLNTIAIFYKARKYYMRIIVRINLR
jgi:hypothetical protein